jgi:tRNA(fMet)-specific endonuclease VapC
VPAIVLDEFRYGIAESRHRHAYDNWLGAHLDSFEILFVTDETAIAYVGVRLALRRAGTSIPANDAWIAALAVQHRMPVLSRDHHFDGIAGVSRWNW